MSKRSRRTYVQPEGPYQAHPSRIPALRKMRRAAVARIARGGLSRRQLLHLATTIANCRAALGQTS